MHGPSAVPDPKPLAAVMHFSIAALFVLSTAACATVKNAAVGAADRATGREVAERVDRGVSAAADGAEDRVMGNDDEAAPTAPAPGPAASEATSTDGAASSGPLIASAGFDFEPGERVLYQDDFASDNLGDFPRSLDWKRGTLEVVDLGGARFLRASSGNATFSIPLGEELPDRFTIEMEIYNPGSPYGLLMTTGMQPQQRNGFKGEPHLQWVAPALYGHGLVGSDGTRLAVQQTVIDGNRGFENRPVVARVMVDAQHMKLYWGDKRIANVPQVELARSEAIHLLMAASPDQPIYVGNIRIAAGGRDLYSVLEREGRFTAKGIEFDSGSERIRPTSRETLDEIGAMLQEHSDLQLVIEGHTDNEGSDASNEDLSERRAASVRTYLIENYGVAGGRLESVGYGEARPIAANDTPDGRQQNRRVELVRAGASGPAASPARSSSGSSAAPVSNIRDSSLRVTSDDKYTRGTVTVTLDGETKTFGADGNWGPWTSSDDPGWVQFSVEAGSAWGSGNPGVSLFASFDEATRKTMRTLSVSNNDLVGVTSPMYSHNSGEHAPRYVVTKWGEAPNNKRVIQGHFEVKLTDGRMMTGEFDLLLPHY